MKKFKLYGILLSLILFSGGCNNFMDQAPDERLTINNLDKVQQTLVSAYPNSRGYRFTHMCTDDVTLTEGEPGLENIIEDLYTWSRNFRDQSHQDCPSEYWRTAYNSIAAVNHALEALDNLILNEEDKGKAAAIRGEALIIRSYQHFLLVNLFSKHYAPETAATDLGVPYVTLPEDKLEINYERGNVEEVYRRAEEDLKGGIRLLEANREYFKTNKYHFTFPTVYLYASRFYTFRNKDAADLKLAIDYAEKSIKAFGGVQVMRLWKDYHSDDNGPVDVYQEEIGMVQNSYSWISFNWKYQTTNSIARKQLMRNPLGFSDTRFQINYRRSGDIFVPAFFFVYNQASSEASATDIFPIAEAVLNAAEGYARMNQIDRALEYIDYLSKTVYENYDPKLLTVENLKIAYKTESEQEALIQCILFERRAEFFMRGMRWFDIRRYNLEIEHLLDDGKILKLSEVSPDKNFQIPNYAIAAGMQPNLK